MQWISPLPSIIYEISIMSYNHPFSQLNLHYILRYSLISLSSHIPDMNPSLIISFYCLSLFTSSKLLHSITLSMILYFLPYATIISLWSNSLIKCFDILFYNNLHIKMINFLSDTRANCFIVNNSNLLYNLMHYTDTIGITEGLSIYI